MANGEPIVIARSDGALEICEGEKTALKVDPRQVQKFRRDVDRAALLALDTQEEKRVP